MKNFILTAHEPVYFTDMERETLEFDNTEELFTIDFVRSHAIQPGFFRYCILKSAEQVRAPLLAEYEGGDKLVVIGFIEGDINNLDLPEWKPADDKVVK